MKPFVPKQFDIPLKLETVHFKIRMLTVNDVIKDYDAVMTSIDHLHKMFPLSDWPHPNLTLEQNLIDLGWHQKEFQKRSSFAYTVISPDESQVLGCLYINPIENSDYDASITLWVRFSLHDDLDSRLFEAVKEWVESIWPFGKVAYPGRDITWEEWDKM